MISQRRSCAVVSYLSGKRYYFKNFHKLEPQEGLVMEHSSDTSSTLCHICPVFKALVVWIMGFQFKFLRVTQQKMINLWLDLRSRQRLENRKSKEKAKVTLPVFLVSLIVGVWNSYYFSFSLFNKIIVRTQFFFS